VRPSEPPFALCGPKGALVADGVQARFCDVPAAEAALRSGAAPILLGALPFDVNAPAALMVPGTVRRTGALPDWPTGPLPPVRIAATVPTPEDVLELRHQVELHNLTGRIVECPLDEINRPRASAPAKGTLSRPRLWGDLESVWATKTMGRVAGRAASPKIAARTAYRKSVQYR